MIRDLSIYAVAGVMMLGAGFAHGVVTNRWSPVDIHTDAASKLDNLPTQIGDWESRDEELNAEAVRIAELTGYVHRQYVNHRTNQHVSLLLMCGRPGPISVHPPTACFRGAGYQQIGKTIQKTINPNESSRHVFRSADFDMPESLKPDHPRIYWAWSNDGNWQSPGNPRTHFAGAQILYKLYVTTTVSAHDETAVLSIDDFLTVAIPTINSHLVP